MAAGCSGPYGAGAGDGGPHLPAVETNTKIQRLGFGEVMINYKMSF